MTLLLLLHVLGLAIYAAIGVVIGIMAFRLYSFDDTDSDSGMFVLLLGASLCFGIAWPVCILPVVICTLIEQEGHHD